MREDCRHFQSRTYNTGEVARLCVLNLAPEAPWRCPENCSRYEPDRARAQFVEGGLHLPQVEDEPDDEPADIVAILDEADAIVTAAGPQILAEVEAERGDQTWWKKLRRRRKTGGDDDLHLREG
jgi:hypothetical protein